MARRSVVNLTMHGIGAPPRPLDPGEDRTWISVEALEHALDLAVSRPHVRITFDDGNRSDLEIALPRLLERSLRAEFFVLAGRLGEPGRLETEDVRELVRAGMQIGSHGWAHRDWRRIAPHEIGDEIENAPRRLADLIGQPVRRVAVPFGSYDRRVLQRLHKTGTERVYTSDGGHARPQGWLQSRTSLRSDMAPADVEHIVDASPTAQQRLVGAAATWAKRLRH